MAETKTVLLCGVGGQGTILAADILARVAQAAGQQAKVSEIHGMAQRGGAVSTVVRFGSEVASMVCDYGSADVVVSFETTEALRNLPFLKEGGAMVVNDESIKPLPVLTVKGSMPAKARERIVDAGGMLIPAENIAREVGNARTANVVLLGALSASLDFPEELWIEVVSNRVPPKTVEANIEALKAGRAFGQERVIG